MKYNQKKIPFKNEVIPICEEIHISLNLGEINSCQIALKNLELFWEGYSSTMLNVIKNCHKYLSLTKNIAEKPVMKYIIPDGPHFRYQSDIWELSKTYLKHLRYKYVLEIKDSFSKLMWCYPLENKEGNTVLIKLNTFLLLLVHPKFFKQIMYLNPATSQQNYIKKI